jgi:hypothetical protein
VPSLDEIKKILEVVASFTVASAAIAAIVKYRMFNLFGHRWESNLACSDRRLGSGRSLFVAEYRVANSGQRPLRIRKVVLTLMGARVDGADGATGLLKPARDRVLCTRTIPDDVGTPGNLDVQPGERSIFTLRCELPELPELVFVECRLEFAHKRAAALFVGLHARQPPTPSASPAAGA